MNSEATPASFLTRREFMAALRISETTYHDLAKRGLIKPLRIGRSVRIPASEVEAVLARLNPDSATAEKAAARRQRRAA